MRHLIAIIFICSSVMPLCGASGRAGTWRDKQAIIRLEHKWLDALNDADIGQIGEILADDFERPAPQAGRFINKATLLRYYRSHLVAGRRPPRRMKYLDVHIYRNVAVARGILIVPNTMGDGHTELLFTDVFARRGGAWRAVSAQENAIGTRG